MKLTLSVIVLGFALVLGSCSTNQESTATRSSSTPTPRVPTGRPTVDTEVLRGNRAGVTYDVIPTIETLAGKMPTVTSGEVVSWSDGAVLVDHDERSYTAVLKIKVDEVWKGASSTEDGYVYVSRPRGGEIIDANGKPVRNPGAPSTITSLEELQAAAPAGVKVLFLGDNGTGLFQHERPPLVQTLAAHAGYPEGARLLRPHPFGMLFEQLDGSLASGSLEGELWQWLDADRSVAKSGQFEALTAKLRTHFE